MGVGGASFIAPSLPVLSRLIGFPVWHSAKGVIVKKSDEFLHRAAYDNNALLPFYISPSPFLSLSLTPSSLFL